MLQPASLTEGPSAAASTAPTKGVKSAAPTLPSTVAIPPSGNSNIPPPTVPDTEMFYASPVNSITVSLVDNDRK